MRNFEHNMHDQIKHNKSLKGKSWIEGVKWTGWVEIKLDGVMTRPNLLRVQLG